MSVIPANRTLVCATRDNVTLFERPDTADEFIIWSIMTNAAVDPRRNAWSGIHTRLSAEMIARDQQVDGVSHVTSSAVQWSDRASR